MRNLEGVNQQGGHRLQEGETTSKMSNVPPIIPVYAIKISIIFWLHNVQENVLDNTIELQRITFFFSGVR